MELPRVFLRVTTQVEAKLLRWPRSRRQDAPPAFDSNVLRRAQRGEEEACRALYRAFHPRVFAFLARMMGSRRADAEDVLQETFIRVFAALPRFDAGGAATLSTWILTIAYRQAVSALRRRRPDAVALSDVTLVAPEPADDEFNRRRIQRVLVEAVLDLAPDHRAVFLLSDYHNLSYEEIASVVGTSVGTVKSRLFRARQRVRDALEAASDE